MKRKEVNITSHKLDDSIRIHESTDLPLCDICKEPMDHWLTTDCDENQYCSLSCFDEKYKHVGL